MNRLCTTALWMLVVFGGLFCRPSAATGQGSGEQVWTNLGLGGGGGMFSPAISPLDGDLMFISCDMGGLYRSTDAGRTWRMVNFRQLAGNTRCAPAFHPTDVTTIYAADGHRGLCVSHDTGITWQPVSTEPPWGRARITALGIGRLNPFLLLVGTGNSAHVSLDAGETWSTCEGPEGEMLGFHVTEARGGPTIFAAGSKGVWRSQDRGKSWSLTIGGLPWTGLRSFCAGTDEETGETVLFVASPSKEVGGTFAGGVYRSGDLGETWQSAMGEGSVFHVQLPKGARA